MGHESRANRGSWRDRKVLFGYPCGGSVTVPFHASCLRMLAHELSKPSREALVLPGQSGQVKFNGMSGGIKLVDYGPDVPMRHLAKMEHASGLYVGNNRMTLTEELIDETPANWLLQIDTDIEFPPTLIETMLELAGTDKKILAASVPLGTAYPTCGFQWSRTPGQYYALEEIPRSPIEVDAIATACVLIHRDVFEAIAREHGRSWFHSIYLAKSPPETPIEQFAFTGNEEDIAFSMRAKASGFSIWVVHIPGLGHYKTIRLSHDDEKSKALAMTHMGEGMGRLVQEDADGPV